MKRILGTMLIIMILLIGTTTFAAQNSNIKQLFDNESISISPDKNDISKVIDDNESHIKDLIKQEKKINVSGIKRDTIIKAYKFNTSDIVASLKQVSSFDKLISNKYVWLSPIIDTNNKTVSILTIDKGLTVDEFNKLPLKFNKQTDKDEALAKVKEREGKWFVSKIGEDLSEEEIDFISDSSKIEKLLLENNINNVSQMKFLLAESHYTNILYIKSGNNEYGIPFSARPDFTGLVNGRLYNISEIINSLSNMSNTTINANVNSNGGATNSSATSTSIKATTVIGILASLFLISLFVIRYIKKLESSD